MASRERIKEAARRVLDRVGYTQIRITDVTGEAGVATGLFHHYFTDMKSLVLELLEDVLGKLDAVLVEAEETTPEWLFGRIRTHHLLIIQTYEEHPGLMRAFYQVNEEVPEFRERAMAQYERELLFLYDQARRAFPSLRAPDAHTLMLMQALGGLAGQGLREYHIYKNPSLAAWDFGPEATAEWLAVLFYRGLVGRDPPAAALQHDAVRKLFGI
jgi:AcrR family transcriptional regulator